MKKYLLILLAACCLLGGCGVNGQPVQPPEAPESVQDALPPEASARISPLPAAVDMAALGNCTVPVSIDEHGIYTDGSGKIMIQFTVYSYELYDMVDIAALKEGDIISHRGEDIVVSSVSRSDSGRVSINGGLDVGGYELYTDESGVYYFVGYNDAKAYYAIGEAVFGVAEDFVFTDGMDFDNPPVSYTAPQLLDKNSGIFFHFVPHNTKLTVENGAITALERVYMP